MTRLRTRHPAALALLVGAALAALVPVGSAVALDSPPSDMPFVQVQSPASLLARGAAVSVPVTYRCAAGEQRIEISVRVVQRSGSETTSGEGSANLPCGSPGSVQEATVTVVADGRVFKKGAAVGSARAFTCGFGFCDTIADSREIMVTR